MKVTMDVFEKLCELSRLELNEHLETKIRNLFTIGDGAGVTRGLIQASASGVIVAREIMRRELSKK